jgi:hypothetical protein
MFEHDIPLDNIRIASPCPADWDAMYGDARKRFCSECRMNVYNISGMTRDEAKALIMNAEGRLCVRFYRRADGTIMTKDCPVGWAKVKQKTRLIMAAGFSLVMALLTGVFFVSLFSRQKATVGELMPPVLPSATPMHTMGVIRPTMGNVAVDLSQQKPNSNFEIGKMRVLKDEKRSGI